MIVRVATQVLESAEPEGLWKAMGQAGLLSLAVPQSLGGEGFGVLEVAVLLRELGHHAASSPALSHLRAVLAVARWAPPEVQHSLLAADTMLTTATCQSPDGDWPAVPYADMAQRILLPTADGITVVDPAEVELEATYSSSGAPEFTVRANEAAGESFWPVDIPAFHQMASAIACAMGDGLLAGALELTTKHIGTREQFGKPLATFQAVAQQIADVYIASRTLHLAALSAAWRLATDRDADSDVDTAVTWLVQEGLPAMRTCHHLHGGIGLDVTYPLHRYTAMMKDLVRHVPRAD